MILYFVILLFIYNIAKLLSINLKKKNDYETNEKTTNLV